MGLLATERSGEEPDILTTIYNILIELTDHGEVTLQSGTVESAALIAVFKELNE